MQPTLPTYPYIYIYIYSLSFVTEQVAEHTNGTIGGLLNATFGNAPELLIATAALRSGYYRIVQLAMLGSMLTNMLFVFGVACLIGGCRWQVQELRTTSGNTNIVMLFVATAGCLFPAALRLSGQYAGESPDVVSPEELTFCRVNAVIMLVMYLLFLLYQLGTHRDEFADDAGSKLRSLFARRNHFCHVLWHWRTAGTGGTMTTTAAEYSGLPIKSSTGLENSDHREGLSLVRLSPSDAVEEGLSLDGSVSASSDSRAGRRRRRGIHATNEPTGLSHSTSAPLTPERQQQQRPPLTISHRSDSKCKNSDRDAEEFYNEGGDHTGSDNESAGQDAYQAGLLLGEGPLISLRIGLVWLLILTLCISTLSDILVDTIDDFALSMRLSEVFTSMVVIPFFSNVAEQVSAFIFAYRNEMDLCVAVTIGSAVQIATFVLPGAVLIGMFMDRSMTLFFGAYETTCLFFSVLVVGAVLTSGTSNWLTGAMLVGIYVIFASGIWFHELEILTVDQEDSMGTTTDPIRW
jgi:Ca2+/H+ antiporter